MCSADRGGSGEEQVIERQPRERCADVGIAGHDGELVLAKQPRDPLLQQRGRGWRELRRLQEHAIARRERADRRRERQLHRVVPRADDAGDTLGLAQDPRSARQQLDRRRDALRPHPCLQMAQRVAHAGRHDVELGEARLLRRAMTEVARHRCAQRGLVVGDDAQQALQPVTPDLIVGIALARERSALRREQPRQIARG